MSSRTGKRDMGDAVDNFQLGIDKTLLGMIVTIFILLVLGLAREAIYNLRARRKAQRLLTPRKPQGGARG